jgi:hypothetical protein
MTTAKNATRVTTSIPPVFTWVVSLLTLAMYAPCQNQMQIPPFQADFRPRKIVGLNQQDRKNLRAAN